MENAYILATVGQRLHGCFQEQGRDDAEMEPKMTMWLAAVGHTAVVVPGDSSEIGATPLM